MQGIHQGAVNFAHKWPVTRKMFPFDDVMMTSWQFDSLRPGTYFSDIGINTQWILFKNVNLIMLFTRWRPFCSYPNMLVWGSEWTTFTETEMFAFWWNFHHYLHDDVIKWKHFPRNWPFVRGIHRWIPLTKASDAELWCFLWSASE